MGRTVRARPAHRIPWPHAAREEAGGAQSRVLAADAALATWHAQLPQPARQAQLDPRGHGTLSCSFHACF